MRALQGAVRNDHVLHAYLFSGPRGTGKTTAARVLAKALNCENPQDGDACCVCASCLAIAKGSSLDVTELDAASNNGVDDIRDITAGAWHGTPGRWKVYIFDEVHQLSKAASAALLKTLEEPPQHVVFVLATTDPHKVLPTIRSRTQQLEFRLLGGDTLRDLLRDVRVAAGLDVDDATIETAVRLARGSARDALSALDQLVATGSLGDEQPQFDGLFRALREQDAVQALTALSVLRQGGWDLEQLAESFASEVRQAFLLQVAPEVADAVDAERARLVEWGSALGLARTVRVLETFGRAMREMKSAPDRNVMLEVALVRLTKPELDPSIDALAERVAKLERTTRAPITQPQTSRREPLPPIGTTTVAAQPAPDEGIEKTAKAPSPPPQESTASTSRTSENEEVLDLDDVRERFVQRVVPRTSRSAQLLLKAAEVRSLDGNCLTIALASEEMRQNTEMIVHGLYGALEHEFKSPLTISWVVDTSIVLATPAPTTRTKRAPVHDVDVDEEVYAPDESAVTVASAADHLITEMFPGSEEIR